jgi:hypothetical protein
LHKKEATEKIIKTLCLHPMQAAIRACLKKAASQLLTDKFIILFRLEIDFCSRHLVGASALLWRTVVPD